MVEMNYAYFTGNYSTKHYDGPKFGLTQPQSLTPLP